MTAPLIFNRDGKCVTPEGLDRFWPRDDREADMTSWYYHEFNGGKGGKALPTCAPGTVPLETQVAAEGHDLREFVFNGPALPSVPITDTFSLMGPVLVMAVVMALRKDKE